MTGWYRSLGAAVVAVAVVAAGVRTLRHRIAVVTVTGQSMQPTLIAGDRVLVHRRDIRELRPGQIVVFQRPAGDRTWQAEPPRLVEGRPGWAIKRLVGIPGDPLPAEILAAASDNPQLLVPGLLVPRRKLLVMGDNPDHSFDSRHFGYVPAEQLLGVVHRKLQLRGPPSEPPHLASLP
jgi:signal peptidase I